MTDEVVLRERDRLGLRERKKLATRQALCDAAMQLAINHGIEGITPERIADAADVSSRTFRNYFSSPEEAIISGMQESARALPANLRARPRTEPIWDSLCIALVTTVEETMSARDLMSLLALVRCHRSLLAEHLTALEEASQQLAEIIAERTGTDVNRDIYPRMLADVARIAVKSSLDLWSQGNTGRDIGEILTEALDLLGRGLSVPATAPPITGST
ncbi:MAG TPA: TetR family transcriptional regulator [Kineosporiaceae bacterium]|nr:TetR family transcriptional regulator [Kineosporiaceae bacterium]